MKKVIDVQIGKVRADRGKVILKSKAIGSCIAIVAYDAVKNVGALAHVMLPGSAPGGTDVDESMKYAADAIDEIVRRMSRLGSRNGDIEVSLVGGGNVLRRERDTICRDNIDSTRELLRKKQLKIRAQAVGGTDRRSVSLDIERGIISYTEDDGAEMQLWRA